MSKPSLEKHVANMLEMYFEGSPEEYQEASRVIIDAIVHYETVLLEVRGQRAMDRQIIDRLHNAVSSAIKPPRSKRDALEILEELAADLEGQIEALKDEIAKEEE